MPSVSNEDYDDDTVAALPFKAEIAGVCRDGFGRLREGVPTGQVEDEAWRCHRGASTRMTPSADCIINYRECNLTLRIADGSSCTI